VKGWIVLLLLVASSCDTSSVVCQCPANGCDTCSQGGTGEVLVPAGLPPVSSATADSSCSAMYQPSANRVLVSRPSEGTCKVTLQLTDGRQYAASVQFKKVNGPCGCYLGASASDLAPTDAGSD
jgi:hypothetical protein